MDKDKFVEVYLGTTQNGNVYSLYIPFEKTDRLAKCNSCMRVSKSNEKLPFFKDRPDKDYDSYYCGDRGWD